MNLFGQIMKWVGLGKLKSSAHYNCWVKCQFIYRQVPIDNDISGHYQSILKQLSGTSDGAVATMFTMKMKNCEINYQSFNLNLLERPVTNLDQVINICVQKTSSSPKALSIADLRQFISAEVMAWPEKAISHIAQMRFLQLSFIFCLALIAKMTYELNVSTSSLGAFSSLWSFHRLRNQG